LTKAFELKLDVFRLLQNVLCIESVQQGTTDYSDCSNASLDAFRVFYIFTLSFSLSEL